MGFLYYLYMSIWVYTFTKFFKSPSIYLNSSLYCNSVLNSRWKERKIETMTVTVTPYKETDIGNAFWRDISFSKCDAIPSPYSFKLKGFPKTTTIVSFTIYFSYWGRRPPP